MMNEEQTDSGQSADKHIQWWRHVLTYGVTIGGIIALCWIAVQFSRSWLTALLYILIILPLVPALQMILLKRGAAKHLPRLYAAEFSSLIFQFLFLMVSAPFIAFAIAGILSCVLLIAAVISWIIVALQQAGVSIGSKMATNDIQILFTITLVLMVASGVFYAGFRLYRRYQDSYFNLWAMQLRKIRTFFHQDIS